MCEPIERREAIVSVLSNEQLIHMDNMVSRGASMLMCPLIDHVPDRDNPDGH